MFMKECVLMKCGEQQVAILMSGIKQYNCIENLLKLIRLTILKMN